MQCRYCRADIPDAEDTCPLCHRPQYRRASTDQPAQSAVSPHPSGAPRRPAASPPPAVPRRAPRPSAVRTRAQGAAPLIALGGIVVILLGIFLYLLLSHYDFKQLLQGGGASSASGAQAGDTAASVANVWDASAQRLVDHYNSKAAVALQAAKQGKTISTDIGDGITVSVEAGRSGQLKSATVKAGLTSLANQTTQRRMLSACALIGGYLTPGADLSASALGIDLSQPEALLGGVDETRDIDGSRYRLRSSGLSLEFSASKR